MSVKQTGQLGFVDALVADAVGGNAVLDRLGGLVNWSRFEEVMKDLRRDGPGRPGYPVLVMFKALLLQALYGLSERRLEEALKDRISFRRFIGLSLKEAVPDHTVLNRFRNDLISGELLDQLFAELDRQLEQAGMVLKRGTMLDATLIEAAAARPREVQPSRDPDARFAKRQGKSGATFGYKAHVGVDQGSGLIRSLVTTPANVNDTVPADGLIRGDERSVLADAAYHTHARERRLKSAGVKPRLMRRPNKHHPALPSRLRRYNRLIARRRASVETTFATLKRRMGLDRIRYIGLAKAAAQMRMAAIAFNMRRWVTLTA